MRAAILCLLLSAVAISADLISDIDDVASQLPLKQLESIGRKYVAADPRIRSALEYLQKVGDEQIYNDVVSRVGYLTKYFKSHGIDGEALLRHMIKMSLDYHRKVMKQPSSDEVESSSEPISGDLTADALKVLAASNILNVIKEKAKTSPEFAHFVAVVSDPEFKALFLKGINTRAIAVEDADDRSPHARGGLKKVWQKIKDVGFGVGVSISFGK